MKEQDKLNQAVDHFADAMKRRLNAKRKEGFHGWDTGSFHSFEIPNRLLTKAALVFALGHTVKKKVLVDIANLAMMLHKKLEDAEQRLPKSCE